MNSTQTLLSMLAPALLHFRQFFLLRTFALPFSCRFLAAVAVVVVAADFYFF
jgi:hypothetical protein